MLLNAANCQGYSFYCLWVTKGKPTGGGDYLPPPRLGLTNRKITDKEYQHVLNVSKKFEIKTMKDYYDLYLKCAVLLLATVFQKVRSNSLKNYELYPSHCLSAPGLSWGVMLKMTKIGPELIPDPDMYVFFEKSTRGGISYLFNRYSKANNKYLKSYDPKEETYYILTCKWFIWLWNV